MSGSDATFKPSCVKRGSPSFVSSHWIGEAANVELWDSLHLFERKLYLEILQRILKEQGFKIPSVKLAALLV